MEKILTAGFILSVLLFIEGVQLCLCTNSSFACVEGERQALLKLRQSFQDNSSRLSSWTGKDCCKWEGVSCSKNTGHVVKLDLRTPGYLIFDELDYPFSFIEYDPSNQLSSPEVNSCLLELKYLEYLDLSGNDFNCSRMPEFFGSLKHLRYLNLSNARFSGMIPHHLGNLTSLQILDLSALDFYGELYADNFQWVSSLSSLQHLDMSHVNLIKALDVIQVLNTLPSLLHLSLDDCYIQNVHFSHASVNFTFLASIQFLSLRGNCLDGPVPTALQNMTALKELDLSFNSFNSSVPLWLGNFKNLVHLNLQWNRFHNVEGGLLSMLNKVRFLKSLYLNKNNLFGDQVLGSNDNSSRCLSYNLEYLSLAYNGIRGRIPDRFGQLKGLRELSVSQNQLSGTIPKSLGGLLSLKSLDLSSNQLSGTIPESLGGLLSLKSLDLSSNQFNGMIPLSLGRLSTLTYLGLSQNKLNGSIPQYLGRVSTLTYLGLSHNQLSGIIPQSLGNASTLGELDLSHNKLTGSIPYSLGQLVNLQKLDISSNSLQGNVSELHFANLSSLRELIIGSNHLTCKVKSDWIPPFMLHYLDMSSCGIIGSQFPQWLRTQEEILELDLSNTNISGGFPILHGMNPNYLDLSMNHISGSLPTDMVDIMPSIMLLLLSNNQINGSIPNSLCNLRWLAILDFSRNKLFGKIPHCWRAELPLDLINLSFNNLSGTIPGSIGQLQLLKWLHMNDNRLEGELPQALRSCKKLELLDLSENKISGNIPPWIGESLLSLRILILRENLFSGNIPSGLCQLYELQILDLSLNNLSGEIPHCFNKLTGMTTENVSEQNITVAMAPAIAPEMPPASSAGPLAMAPAIAPEMPPASSAVPLPMPTLVMPPSPGPSLPVDGDTIWNREKVSVVMKGASLEYSTNLRLLDTMDLSSNNLNGSIPEDLVVLSGLRNLNLSHNHLSGKIPYKIGALKSIESLDLSDNQLFGTIPSSISTLNSLNHLNLSHNNLSGKIPKGSQLQTLIDPSIYAGNLQLCGDPLPKKCPSDDEPLLPPISTGHHDKDNKSERILFYFVIFSGYATGFWAVIGTLIFKRDWRLAYFCLADDIKEWILATVAVNVTRLKRMMEKASDNE